MKRTILALCLVIGGQAVAQAPDVKPGLWQVKPISQVVDGRDVLAAMMASQARMQQSLANLPPDQRQRMEATMGGMLTARLCLSPAIAAQGVPMVDPEGKCQPENVERNGDKTSFEFHCSRNGRTSVGTGERTGTGNVLHTRMDMTTTDAKGSHRLQSEAEMTYIGADCQGVKSVDQLGKN
jgi:hypothetical protein